MSSRSQLGVLKSLLGYQLALDQTRKTTIEMVNMVPSVSSPQPGSNTVLQEYWPFRLSDTLTVRLIHHTTKPDQIIKIEQKEELVPEHRIPQSDTFILEDIMIQNNSTGSSASGLTFEPGARNTLKFIVPPLDKEASYQLRDVELLGEDGLPYQPIHNGDGKAEVGKLSVQIEEVDAEEDVTTSKE